MKFFITLSVIFSTVTALAVPHPHPEESKIDIATRLAAANVPPEDDNFNEHHWHLKQYGGDDQREDKYILGSGDSIISLAEEDSLRTRTEGLVSHEYDDAGDFLEKREHIVDGMDENYSPEILPSEQHWHSKPPGIVVNKRDEENDLRGQGHCNQAEADHTKQEEVNYVPTENQDSGNLKKIDDDLFRGTDTDYLVWKRSAPPRDDEAPLINECLWKFKKDDSCVERSDEEKLRKKDIKADDEMFMGDEGYERYEGYDDDDGEADFEYISKRGESAYDEGEEYLREIYEGIHYEEYLQKRDSCRCGRAGDVDVSQTDCGCHQAEDDCRCRMEEGQYSCSGDSKADCLVSDRYGSDDTMEREANKSGCIEDLPTDNSYLCETTKDSPKFVDVVEIANIFKYQKGGERCTAKNALDSKCTKLGGLESAQIAICTIHTGWFLYCDDVGIYVLELSKGCKTEIDGIWRVGGTIFHESGKGSAVVY